MNRYWWNALYLVEKRTIAHILKIKYGKYFDVAMLPFIPDKDVLDTAGIMPAVRIKLSHICQFCGASYGLSKYRKLCRRCGKRRKKAGPRKRK